MGIILKPDIKVSQSCLEWPTAPHPAHKALREKSGLSLSNLQHNNFEYEWNIMYYKGRFLTFSNLS